MSIASGSRVYEDSAERSSSVTSRPPSWSSPAYRGLAKIVCRLTTKGPRVESLTFETDKTIKRATVPVHGRG